MNTLHTFGDSITAGVGASSSSNRYANLLASALGKTLENHGVSGSCAADQGPMVYPVTLAESDIATIMLGTNDERHYGDSATKRGYYRRGLAAIAAYLALPEKQLAISSGAYTGTWVSTSVYGIGKNSNTQGSKATFTVSGTTVYIGMIQQDNAPGEFTVKIDGNLQGVFVTETVDLLTVNGSSYGPMLLRFPGLSPGSHTVEIEVTSTTSASSKVYVDWVAGNVQTLKPYVYLINTPRAQSYSTGGSDANVGIYNLDALSLVNELSKDGLNVFMVNSHDVLSPNEDMDGGYHPINTGHKKIADAIVSKIAASQFKCAYLLSDGKDFFISSSGQLKRLLTS